MDRKTAAVAVAALALVAVGGGAAVYTGVTADAPPEAQFAEVSNEVGLERFPIQEPENPPGSGRQGVYVADVNNDHWEDLLVVGGRDSPSLYENTGGTFERTGALPDDPIMDTRFKGALFLDYNDDGWTDLLLLAPHPKSSVFLENRNGSFRVDQAGFYFDVPNGATTLDYNGDGCLDVFVYQNGDWGDRNPRAYRQPNETFARDNGNPNALLRGNCSTFEFVEDAGINGSHWSLAASAADFDGDGRTDVHVANDFYNDTVYYNEGNGTFDRVALGAATDRNGMSSEVADANRDGRPDLFVTNIRVPALDRCRTMAPDEECSNVGAYIRRYVGDRNQGNNLLVNRGGSFVDVAAEYGVTEGGWGWAASMNDFDNDGDLDLFHTTEDLSLENRANLSRPKYYERVGRATFRSRNTSRMGFGVHSGRGVATLDHDHDGALDLVVAEHPRNTVFDIHVYENRGAGDGNWLAVEVTGPDGGAALGARVEADTGNRTVVRRVNPRTDFFSQDSRVVHLGLGDRERVESLRIVWPDGTTKRLSNVTANGKLVVSPGGVERIAGNTSDGGDGGGLLPVELPSIRLDVPSPGAVLARVTRGLPAPPSSVV